MSTPAHRASYTWDEYLALEATSNVKHEFLAGQIFGMAGGTPEHAALSASLIGLLFAQLRTGRFRAHGSDLRVRVRETGLATYPDVTIVCGPVERDPDDPNGVTNPTVIAEVLSPSTERYDRGDKFEHYQCIPSLRQYVIVAHDQPRLEVWTRGSDGAWASVTVGDGDIAELPAIGARVDVRELYAAAALPAA